MPVSGQDGRRTTSPLAKRVGEHALPARTAEEMERIWLEIDDALTPILGRGGVAALYKRSLHLARAAHPWLAAGREGTHAAMDLAALKVLLMQQTSADATAGGDALLQTFYDLLASLVGPSLTERLLRSVWSNAPSGPSTQDTST